MTVIPALREAFVTQSDKLDTGVANSSGGAGGGGSGGGGAATAGPQFAFDTAADRSPAEKQPANDGWNYRDIGSAGNAGETLNYQIETNGLPPAALPAGAFPGAAGKDLSINEPEKPAAAYYGYGLADGGSVILTANSE